MPGCDSPDDEALMRRLIDELSFRVRVVLTILIVATARVIVAWDEPVITALVDMARLWRTFVLGRV
jgi:predicted nucleic acid-binding protein